MNQQPPHRPVRFPLAGALAPSLAILGLAACSSAIEPQSTKWEGTLEAVHGASLLGQAAAVSEFGSTRTSIAIQIAEPGVRLGWRIEEGICPGPGTLQGGTASYPFLDPGESGSASAETVISSVLKADRQYSVRVFLFSGEDDGETVACGNLELIP